MARYYTAKADANQSKIVAKLRGHFGDTIRVDDTHMVKKFCDIVVTDLITRRVYLVEIKRPGKERDLSAGNIDFAEAYDFRLPYILVSDAGQLIAQIEEDRRRYENN